MTQENSKVKYKKSARLEGMKEILSTILVEHNARKEKHIDKYDLYSCDLQEIEQITGTIKNYLTYLNHLMRESEESYVSINDGPEVFYYYKFFLFLLKRIIYDEIIL